MTGYLLVGVGILYGLTALSYVYDKNLGMALAFLCYALANVGLYYGGK